MKERDRLLEQTLAFVQGVAAQRPVNAIVAEARPEVAAIIPPADRIASDAASVETDALISLIALSQSTPDRDDDSLQAAVIAVAVSPRPAAAPLVHKPAVRRPIELMLPERDVIAQRVARFRAGQQKLLREREDHYAASQARIRSSLGNDPRA